jgi:hypothetical protein
MAYLDTQCELLTECQLSLTNGTPIGMIVSSKVSYRHLELSSKVTSNSDKIVQKQVLKTVCLLLGWDVNHTAINKPTLGRGH